MELNNNYFIREDYIIRDEIKFLDTSNKTDEYQDDVYKLAHEISSKFSINKIADVGCGSGYKLKKYFSDFDVIGYDLEPTISELKIKYPNEKWYLSDFNSVTDTVDMVICADVIEHVLNPDDLINWIKGMNPKHIIISTPDRDLLVNMLGRPILGPPGNQYHIREWTSSEFYNYMKHHFDVIDQRKIQIEYGQVIHCKPKELV